MNIAFCIREGYDSKVGGDSIQCINTKKFLESLYGLNITVITNPEALDNSYDIVHIFNLATREETNLFFEKTKLLNKSRIALSTIFWNYEYITAKDIAKLFDYAIPTSNWQSELCVFLCKVFSAVINKPRIISKPFRNFCKQCINNADILLPNSIEELCELENFTGLSHLSEKAYIVPNATAFSSKEKAATVDWSSYSIPENYILQIGRLEYTKNQLNVVRALMDEPQIPIVFIGSSNDAQYERKLKKLSQKRGNVFFIPFVPHGEIALFYKKAILHILPSFRESPGLVSLEALSEGCKIVVSDKRFTPVDTYFQNNATIINPASVKSIKEGVFKELKMERNMDEIRANILSKFSWSNAAKATYEGYKKIVGRLNI